MEARLPNRDWTRSAYQGSSGDDKKCTRWEVTDGRFKARLDEGTMRSPFPRKICASSAIRVPNWGSHWKTFGDHKRAKCHTLDVNQILRHIPPKVKEIY